MLGQHLWPENGGSQRDRAESTWSTAHLPCRGIHVHCECRGVQAVDTSTGRSSVRYFLYVTRFRRALKVYRAVAPQVDGFEMSLT
jgi:hypothetical protein